MGASLLALAFVAGLAAIERKGFLQAMLSRPIALGPITGLVLGDVGSGLFVAAPLELLWLGAVNMGAALPVHEALGSAVIAGGTVIAFRELGGVAGQAPGTLPAVAVLTVALCAPVAHLGRLADRLVERRNEKLCLLAERELALGHPSTAAGVNLHGLLGPFGVAFVIAPITAGLAAAVVTLIVKRFPDVVPLLGLGWVAFAGFACAAGARALRSRRAPAFYVGALAIGCVLIGAVALADPIGGAR